jgi:hypothetical protein
MTKALLIGGSVVGGIFVGFVVCNVVKKKGPGLLQPLTAAGKRISGVIANAKQQFSDGFTDAYYGSPREKAVVTA